MAARATSRSTPSGTGTTRRAGLLTTVDSLPRRLAPRHAVADGHVADTGADGGDGAGALLAEDERRRHGVDALPLVDVDEVDAGGGDLDLHLAVGGVGEVVGAYLQDAAVAGLGDEDAGRLGHARHPTTGAAGGSGRWAPAAPMRTSTATSSSSAAEQRLRVGHDGLVGHDPDADGAGVREDAEAQRVPPRSRHPAQHAVTRQRRRGGAAGAGPATFVVTPIALLAKKSTTRRSSAPVVRPMTEMRANVRAASGEALSQSIRAFVTARRPSGVASRLGNRRKTRAKRLPSSRGRGSSSGRRLTGTIVTRSTGARPCSVLVGVQGPGHGAQQHVVEGGADEPAGLLEPGERQGLGPHDALALPGQPTDGAGRVRRQQQVGDDLAGAQGEAGAHPSTVGAGALGAQAIPRRATARRRVPTPSRGHANRRGARGGGGGGRGAGSEPSVGQGRAGGSVEVRARGRPVEVAGHARRRPRSGRAALGSAPSRRRARGGCGRRGRRPTRGRRRGGPPRAGGCGRRAGAGAPRCRPGARRRCRGPAESVARCTCRSRAKSGSSSHRWWPRGCRGRRAAG